MVGKRGNVAVQDNRTEQLDQMIRTTLKALKQASAHQVWTWAGNRGGNLLEIEQRMREMAAAGTLSSIRNSAPPAYRLGKGRR